MLAPVGGRRCKDGIARTDHQLFGAIGDGHHQSIRFDQGGVVGEELAAGDVQLATDVVAHAGVHGDPGLASPDPWIVRTGRQRFVERVVEPDPSGSRCRRPLELQITVDEFDLDPRRRRLGRLRGLVGQRRLDRLIGDLLGEAEPAWSVISPSTSLRSSNP